MPLGVDELIGSLDDASGAGEDAKYELIARGVEIVPQLAARVGTLGRFGKLSAIEIFEALKDQRACPALVELLTDAADTVVEWSADALGALRCHDAIGPLREVSSRTVAAQVPPDWTGPVTFRRALTDLGARQPVVPSLTARLLQHENDSEMQLVPSAHLAAVVEDLADHDQVVLGFMLWRVAGDGHLYWTESAHAEWRFDWSARWMDSVAAARQAALDAAATVAPGLLVRIEWVDESDLATGLRAGRES